MSDQPIPDDATPLTDHEPAPGHEDEMPDHEPAPGREDEVPGGDRDIPPDRGATPLI